MELNQEAWTVLTCKATAILVEGGFMDTTSDYEYMCTEKGQRAYAKAIADSVIEYLALERNEKEVEESTSVESVVKPNGETWYQVVVGSYLGKNKANEIKAKLEAKGFTDVWIDVVQIKGETWYRVICGSYQDRANADKIKAKLDKFYTGVWINIK